MGLFRYEPQITVSWAFSLQYVEIDVFKGYARQRIFGKNLGTRNLWTEPVKKTFQFKVAHQKPDRQIELIRAEIKKYLARERRKKLPDGADFWSFDCKIGETKDLALPIEETEIKPSLNQYYQDGKSSFYLEILAKPAKKQPKP